MKEKRFSCRINIIRIKKIMEGDKNDKVHLWLQGKRQD